MMEPIVSAASIQRHPHWTILAVFAAWKLLLGLIAYLTPSPAYDTSTSLALLSSSLSDAGFLRTICESLTRWDAIYFTKVAERGYINEQEWAFGWGYAQAIILTRQVLSTLIPPIATLGLQYSTILSAIFLSNASHLASSLVLYHLTLRCNKDSPKPRLLALLSSLLHILSPAGLFLSAPYSESLFSLLTFTGTLLYTYHPLLSGPLFLLAPMVRSNGILNILIFLPAILNTLPSLLHLSSCAIFRLAILGFTALLIPIGMILPQYLAYNDFCVAVSPPSWCAQRIPSIYSWVQGQYWDVGLFRYWKVSNIPLFVLAAPTLAVMFVSGFDGVKRAGLSVAGALAGMQVMLAAMAVASYHVQIITRLGSGCVVWYWWVARKVVEDAQGGDKRSGWVLRWMIMYALIQAVLFAGFLPPA